MKDAIWITWERQPRNKSMAKAIGAELHEILPHRDNVLKYFVLIAKTIQLILKKKPRFVFAQNPSIVLSALTCVMRKLLGFRLVIDEHNAGLFPPGGERGVLSVVAKWIVRQADFVIVTNNNLKVIAEEWGGSAFVMPDPLPAVGDLMRKAMHGLDKDKFNLLFICSWSEDEPYEQLLAAAELLRGRSDLCIYVTGNHKKRGIGTSDVPSNVKLLGFIPESLYYAYLRACSATVVLTTRDNCLNCGAYESVNAEKPGILSNHQALRNLFNKGFVYSDSSSESIARSIDLLMLNFKELNSQVDQLKHELDSAEAEYVSAFNERLSA